MYNGIGLQTPRGSGTNGYVQRNMSFVQKSRDKVNYKTEEDIKKLDALFNKKPNQGILAHERKRTIELKCLEMQELMEDQGYPDDEIDTKVAMFRQMLMEKDGVGEKEKDEFGRPIVKESHQIAEANQEKNSKMREALGISQYFVEGSSLDPERRAKEAAAAAAEEAKKKYTLIPDSSSSSSPERSQGKEKDKKRKKKKSHSSREKIESSPKKKKNVKKHKKERSVSPDVQKKKKPKKPVKEKLKHKSKSDASRKKQHGRSSSSCSSSSSDSADEESSTGRSTSRESNSDSDVSQERHKKHEKAQKGHRKRSTSSERIRYSKDARSRKDIYEAKKAKYKRKPARTSSSSDDSSPKQYYRLEPVLLKSKSKHKKAHQIIEIPKKSTFELKKYDKKKRAYESSSSSEVEALKPENKRHKRSVSPVAAKISKHRSERDEARIINKMGDSYKYSRRSEKDSQSTLQDRHRQDRSGSSDSQRKSHNIIHTIVDDDSNGNRRKVKERPKEVMDDRRYEKESKSKKKHSRKDTESPMQYNGYSKHTVRSHAQEMDDSDRSVRSVSIHKHKKHVPRSPSHSPVIYKNKKHVLESPLYQPPSSHKKKFVPKSPSRSPAPKKSSSKHHRSRQNVSESPPLKRTGRHDSASSRSCSPIVVESKRNGRDHKATISTTKGSSKLTQNPHRRRDESNSMSRSPSQHRNPKMKAKHRSKHSDRSPSGSVSSEQSESRYTLKDTSTNSWKSKGEVKDVSYRSRSNSPVHHKSSHTKLRKGKASSGEPTEPQNKIPSPKVKKGMTVIVESCQISPSKESVNPNDWNRNSSSVSPNRVPPSNESKKQKKDNETEKKTDKISPVWSKNKDSCPKGDKVKPVVAKVSGQSLSSQGQEVKIKRGSTDDGSSSAIVLVSNKDHSLDESFTAKKNNWNVISNGDNSCSLPHNTTITQSPVAKGPSMSRSDENTTSNAKDTEYKSGKQFEAKRPTDPSEKSGRRKAYSPSQSRSASENPDQEKSAKNKERTPDLSRSRSRSTSMARSRSGSERSSRSRSYSHRGSKGYSQSRSQSYSRSRSQSRSKSRSRSRSKSYSRSRSISIYSRSRSRSYSSRSRSRSIARSPSIPRRRGSPSFLDKRRITSARKRPVPYRRPSPSTPSSTSSWSYRSTSPISRSSSPVHPSSPLSRGSSRSLRSRSQSWSPLIRPKYQVALNTALR